MTTAATATPSEAVAPAAASIAQLPKPISSIPQYLSSFLFSFSTLARDRVSMAERVRVRQSACVCQRGVTNVCPNARTHPGVARVDIEMDGRDGVLLRDSISRK